MTQLQELLSKRDSVSSAELMQQLRAGLQHTTAASGTGAATHQLLLDYFKLDARASDASFASAFKKYPDTAQTLLALCATHQLGVLHGLMQSLMDGQAKPQGAFKRGLQAQATALADKPGVVAALQGFASAAFASPTHEVEMELSLAWGGLEDCLLDRVAEHAAVIDFAWGPAERKKRQQAQAVQLALTHQSALELLRAFLSDGAPQVLAQPSEWDMAHAGAPANEVPIAVHHVAMNVPLPESWRAHLTAYPGAAQLLAVYEHCNGMALFCTNPHDLWSAGFVFLPTHQWDEARAEMLDWLSSVDFQDDPDSLPEWVRSAIAFGKIPGDASYWILPIEGPFAGQVLLSNEDVSAESSRYANFDSLVATLRLFPQDILGSGGYVSYISADHPHALYPVGYESPSVCQN